MTGKGQFQIRPSQVTRTFGPGSIYDNQQDSVVVMGLDYWKPDQFEPIPDLLLRLEIGKIFRDVDTLVSVSSPKDPENPGHVPVQSFPTWGFCPVCHKLVPKRDKRTRAEVLCDSGQCKARSGSGERETPKTYPVRLVAACANGHLDDFPWYEWVHRTQQERDACGRGQAELYLETNTGSLSIASTKVRCRGKNCTASPHSLGPSMSNNGLRHIIPGCTKRMPWLGRHATKCDDADGNMIQMKGVFKGATNMYFPFVKSAVTIPPFSDDLAEMISAAGDEIQKFREESEDFEGWLVTKFELKSKKRPNAAWTLEDALKKISEMEEFTSKDKEIDVYRLEFDALCSKNCDDREFVTENLKNIPEQMSGSLSSAVIVKKARVVSVITGFTRLEPHDPASGTRIASITTGRPTWFPAMENRCEGIFLGFDSAALDEWEKGDQVTKRLDQILTVHGIQRRTQGNSRHTAKYVFLHTLSHMLMKAFSRLAGHSIASFTERIYCGDGMAGIFIFTSSPSSDGALGGMAEMGRGRRPAIWTALRSAISDASRCSCDPLCSKREPSKTPQPSGSACHACALLPETCCEQMNRLLDRGMVGDSMTDSIGFMRS